MPNNKPIRPPRRPAVDPATATEPSAQPFWKTKALWEMSHEEWESLCDGCARCCVHKVEDKDTGEVQFTNVACRLLDTRTCRCRSYADRTSKVPDCLQLTPAHLGVVGWLPDTCAYRVLYLGGELAWWHPLVSGRPESVHEAGISVRGKVISELEFADRDELYDLLSAAMDVDFADDEDEGENANGVDGDAPVPDRAVPSASPDQR